MRVLIQTPPFVQCSENQSWHLKGLWPCSWIKGEGLGETPFVAAYRKRFSMDCKKTIRVHVSADERYELFLDGRSIGRGSEYGSVDNWYYETYDIALDEGEHVIVAKVWSLGALAPHAQITLGHGFIFAPESYSELIGTGTSQWECKKLEGVEFVELRGGYLTPFWGTGANLKVYADKFPWGFETGAGDGWTPVEVLHEGTNGYLRNGSAPSHLMRPAVLPAMIKKIVKTGVVRFVSETAYNDLAATPISDCENIVGENSDWDLIAKDRAVTVPPRTNRRIIYDLQDYYCAYPSIITSGGVGSRICLEWAESLFNEQKALTKGNRNQIEGKYFLGVGDTFFPDGGSKRAFETLWWQAGRYVQLHVQTADEPVTIERLRLTETRYPLEMESFFTSDDARLSSVIPIALRGLQMCSHEIFFDCPYYEQLMYSGDTRLQILATLTATEDSRLPRKAIETFDISRVSSGLTRSLYPSRYRQFITPFSLAWVGMVHDFALWRGDCEFIKHRMPGVRNVLDAVMNFLNSDGMIERPDGWNFIDWVPEWNDGVPPGAESGVSGIINLYVVYVLNLAARLEDWMNEPELKARYIRLADNILKRSIDVFWDPRRGMFADDMSRSHFSEHAQCLAVLSGRLDLEKLGKIRHSLSNEKNIARTTISFSHYLFETYRELNLVDLFFERMGLWFDLESKGLKTTPEWPEPTRSDCHGWGAHPIYHYFATILGIRPGSMGFTTVDIKPQFGHLKHIKGDMVHPFGSIKADIMLKNNHLSGCIRLPHNIHGTLRYNGKSVPLYGGVDQIIDC